MKRKIQGNFCFLITLIMPYFLGLIISISLKKIISNYNYEIDYIMGAVTTVTDIWGTLLGFIISAVSILIGFNGSQRIKEITQTRHYRNILYTYLLTCVNLLISVSIFIPIIMSKVFNTVIFQIFIGAIVITLINTAFCVFYLCLMIIASFNQE